MQPRTDILIGYDCAVQDKNSGLARGEIRQGRLTLTEAFPGDSEPAGAAPYGEASATPARPAALTASAASAATAATEPTEAMKAAERVARTIAHWISAARTDGRRVVLAVDAPLGWPEPMGPALAGHAAGDPLDQPANDLFRRETDRVVRRLYGRQTLDVGADRIARTALRALAVLEQVRRITGLGLPVAVDAHALTADLDSGPVAIEAYPAGWLAATRRLVRGYRADAATRRTLFDQIWDGHAEVARESVCESPHVFDASVCVQIARDFVHGRCVSPQEVGVAVDIAKREGWIWLPRPEATTTSSSEGRE